jgi:hypothetical protein
MADEMHAVRAECVQEAEDGTREGLDGPVSHIFRRRPEGDGKQPGDPAKAAAAILTALQSDEPPLRLVLGNDAVDAISDSLDGAKAELAAWERVGRSAVFDS